MEVVDMAKKDYGFIFEEPTVKEEESKIGGRTIPAGEWLEIPTEGTILRRQREALGLTQQQVADEAEIALRQYQRFEAGERSLLSSSFRIGLSVCKALKIDPTYFCED